VCLPVPNMMSDTAKAADKEKETGFVVSETTPSADAQEHEMLERKIAELTETLQRLQAEFANYQKRADRDMDSFRKFASQDLIMDLLPVLDSLSLALQHTGDKDAQKGIELVARQLSDVLHKRGLARIDNTALFDAKLHEALLTQACDKPEGTILEVLQEGYTLQGRVIRAAKVKIAKKSA